MTKPELKMYDEVKTENIKYWIPAIWFSNLVSKARQEGRILDDMTYNMILKAIFGNASICLNL